MSKLPLALSAWMLIAGLTGCAGNAASPSPDSGTSSSAATVQPTALEDCVTAVGADRTQCRAK